MSYYPGFFEPETGNCYWFINDYGQAKRDTWLEIKPDKCRRSFLDVFPTKKAAEERIKEIKKLLKK